LALAGKLDEAFAELEESLLFNPQERIYRPAAIAYRGELHLLRGEADLAKSDFQQATTLAQGMGAKAWELHATLSMAKLLRSQGDGDAASTMIERVLKTLPEPPSAADQTRVDALLGQAD
jgi:tetratricopeptide (TPR) repeat protein